MVERALAPCRAHGVAVTSSIAISVIRILSLYRLVDKGLSISFRHISTRPELKRALEQGSRDRQRGYAKAGQKEHDRHIHGRARLSRRADISRIPHSDRARRFRPRSAAPSCTRGSLPTRSASACCVAAPSAWVRQGPKSGHIRVRTSGYLP